MKNLLKSFMVLAMIFSLASCSTEPLESEMNTPEVSTSATLDLPDIQCTGQDPISRLTNQSNEVANLEVFDHQGSLMGHKYNLQPGEVSSWISFLEGETTFRITTPVSEKVIVIDMFTCTAYDVTIDANNQLDTGSAIIID